MSLLNIYLELRNIKSLDLSFNHLKESFDLLIANERTSLSGKIFTISLDVFNQKNREFIPLHKISSSNLREYLILEKGIQKNIHFIISISLAYPKEISENKIKQEDTVFCDFKLDLLEFEKNYTNDKDWLRKEVEVRLKNNNFWLNATLENFIPPEKKDKSVYSLKEDLK